MTLTKFGHSCMLIEDAGARVLVDPGSYSDGQNKVKNIDAILISHEHQDHCDLSSLRAVMANNPKAIIYTNAGVGALLAKENIAYKLFVDGNKITVAGLTIEAIGEKHAVIHESLPIADNTGYLFANKLFYPGDAFTLPKRLVEILALPMAAPWLKFSEAMDYALAIKPKVALPVHDGILKNPGLCTQNSSDDPRAAGNRFYYS